MPGKVVHNLSTVRVCRCSYTMKCYSGESGGTEPEKKPSDANQLGKLGKWIAILIVVLIVCVLFPPIGALLIIGGVIAIPIWIAVRSANRKDV